MMHFTTYMKAKCGNRTEYNMVTKQIADVTCPDCLDEYERYFGVTPPVKRLACKDCGGTGFWYYCGGEDVERCTTCNPVEEVCNGKA